MMRKGIGQAVLIAILLTACGLGEGGLGLPRQLGGETYPGDRFTLDGVMQVSSNGCFQLKWQGRIHYVIWPAGSTLDDQVRLPNGEVIREGDHVTGIGALTPTAPLVANRDGYWAYAIGYCAPGAEEVIVLDSAERGS